MPIYTRKPIEITDPRQIATESTNAEAFGAGAYSMYEGFFGSTLRGAELEDAEQAAEAQSWLGRTALNLTPFGRTEKSALSPMLDPEMARQQLRDNGLDQNLSVPDGGIRQATLDILMSRKRDELRRQTIMAESVGVSGFTANLVGALAGSFVDPSNVALAFVPVVGQAKYGQMLARAGGVFGRAGVRVGVGGLEGLVGLAPVEVLNYYAHQQQQSDYDAYDSMIAIAGGAFFGSALHGGAGLLGDSIRGFKPVRETRPTLDLVTEPGAVPQLRPLTAAEYERSVVMQRLAEGQPVTRKQAMDAARPRSGAEAGTVIDTRLAELELAANTGLLDAARVRALVAEADELDALLRVQDKLAGEGAVLSPEGRLTPQERDFADQRRLDIRAELEGHKTAQSAGKQLEGLQSKLSKIDSDSDLIRLSEELMPPPEGIKFVESLSPATRKALDDDPFMPVRPFIAGLDQATQAASLRMAIAQAVSGRPVDVSPALFTDAAYFNPESAFAAAQRNADMVDGADPEASKWADTIKPLDDDIETARAEVADEEAFVRDMMEASGREMSEPFKQSINAAVLESKKQSAAARSAAMCMMRTGG